MKKLLVLMALFVCGLNALVLQAQNAKGQALSLSVRSERKKYSVKGNIQLEIQLENVGDEPVLVCRDWGWGVGRTDVQVFDSSGKQVVTPFLADELPPPPNEKDFIELKPHEFFGIRLNEEAVDFVNEPGTYDFLVKYTSTVRKTWAAKYLQLPHVPLWSRERGTIVSNRITITITK